VQTECRESQATAEGAHTVGNHFVFSKSAQYALAHATADKDKVVPGVDAVGEAGGGSCRYRWWASDTVNNRENKVKGILKRIV
jgi:hypothetical protein